MKCWICGSDANSGEHKAKASDVRSLLGTPTNKIPFHLRMGDKKLKLKGVDTDLLKWNQKICSQCNNSLSAPYDKAWEIFSSFLQKHSRGLPSINLKTVFGAKFEEQYLNFYLYFIKQFGCYVSSSNADIDLKSFSDSLVNKEVNPNFYIRLSFFRNWPVQKIIALTDMSIQSDDQGVCAAIAGYGIGPWCVDMAYWDPRVPAPPIISSSCNPPTKNEQMRVFVTNTVK